MLQFFEFYVSCGLRRLIFQPSARFNGSFFKPFPAAHSNIKVHIEHAAGNFLKTVTYNPNSAKFSISIFGRPFSISAALFFSPDHAHATRRQCKASRHNTT